MLQSTRRILHGGLAKLEVVSIEDRKVRRVPVNLSNLLLQRHVGTGGECFIKQTAKSCKLRSIQQGHVRELFVPSFFFGQP